MQTIGQRLWGFVGLLEASADQQEVRPAAPTVLYPNSFINIQRLCCHIEMFNVGDDLNQNLLCQQGSGPKPSMRQNCEPSLHLRHPLPSSFHHRLSPADDSIPGPAPPKDTRGRPLRGPGFGPVPGLGPGLRWSCCRMGALWVCVAASLLLSLGADGENID